MPCMVGSGRTTAVRSYAHRAILGASRRILPRAMELTVTATGMVDNADATNNVTSASAGTTVIADPNISGGYVLQFTQAGSQQATTSKGFAMPANYTFQVTFRVTNIGGNTSVVHIPGNLLPRLSSLVCTTPEEEACKGSTYKREPVTCMRASKRNTPTFPSAQNATPVRGTALRCSELPAA